MTRGLTQIPDSIFNPLAFTYELENSQELPTIFVKDQISRVTEHLTQQFRYHRNARGLIKLRADFVDHLLQILWKRYGCDKLGHALIACGGYGRSELFPHSDLDILILLGKSKKKGLKEIEIFLTTSIFKHLPNIVCLPSSSGFGTTVIKNCDPLLLGPVFAIASTPPRLNLWELLSSGKVYPGPPVPIPLGSPP